MAILNEAELNVNIASTQVLIDAFTDGNQNTALQYRDISNAQQQQDIDLLESLQSYGGVINDGIIPTIGVTAIPQLWTYFTTNATSPNDLLEADQTNSKVKVFEPGLYFVTLRFNGSWPANEDILFAIYANGVANPITPIALRQEGQGAGDPVIVSVTDIAFVIPSSLIIDQGDGDYCAVELWYASDTGSFNVAQEGITLGVEYNPLSIRTVG